MRIVLMVSALIAACIASAAIAQEQAPTPFQWEERPTARSFSRARPQRSYSEGVSGYSLMCCSVRPDRRLSCEVAVDWPSGYGFDRAAQRVMGDFRLTEESYAALADQDVRIRRGIVWLVGGATPEFEAALGQIHEATKATCMPSGVEASPGADDIVATVQRVG